MKNGDWLRAVRIMLDKKHGSEVPVPVFNTLLGGLVRTLFDDSQELVGGDIVQELTPARGPANQDLVEARHGPQSPVHARIA